MAARPVRTAAPSSVAREINQLYRSERRRAAELERRTSQLGESHLGAVRALTAAVEAWDPLARLAVPTTSGSSG